LSVGLYSYLTFYNFLIKTGHEVFVLLLLLLVVVHDCLILLIFGFFKRQLHLNLPLRVFDVLYRDICKVSPVTLIARRLVVEVDTRC